jgi:adenylate cyclase, class 2
MELQEQREHKEVKAEVIAADSLLLYLRAMHLNFEFKAGVEHWEEQEAIIRRRATQYAGEDHQVDTYFNVAHGRLKLRQGTIENALIQYQRTNTADAKESKVILYQHTPDNSLKEALVAALGIKVVVDKKRKIYFIDNVKFHFDYVEELGHFVEVEAIDIDGSVGIEPLKEQCKFYAELLKIQPQQMIAQSYSDLLLAKNSSTR